MNQTTSLARQQQMPAERGLTLATVSQMSGYDLAQIAMIRHNMATSSRMAPDQVPLYDIALFCHAARTLELDPLLRQCYWIRRQGKGTLQVGIDGYRAIAERTGVYAGSEPPHFASLIEITHSNRRIAVPERAQVTVWKVVAGHKCAFTGEARWSEFYPGDDESGFMYRKMPYHMLAKDAEAQALRKAFPAQLGTVQYASDAVIDQAPALEPIAEPPPHQQVIERPRARLSDEQLAADYDRMYQHFYDQAQDMAQFEAERKQQPEHAPEAEQPEAAPQAAELARNVELVTQARRIGIKGLGPLTSNPSWPDDKIAEANAALEGKIAEATSKARGDQDVARHQEGML